MARTWDEYVVTLGLAITPLEVRETSVVRDAFILLNCIEACKKSIKCSVCLAIAPIKDHPSRRRVRHFDFEGKSVFLEFAFPRVKCSVHGVIMAHQNFFVPHSSFTIPFEDNVLEQVEDGISESELARRVGIHRNVLRRILDRCYRRHREFKTDPSTRLDHRAIGDVLSAAKLGARGQDFEN